MEIFMNRTVLVTGASRGIGRAIASAFAAEGDRLIITCSRSEQELLNFKKELEETFHTEVLASVGDISSFEYVEQLFEQITERFGGVDVLINNAGISYIGLLTDMSIDDWNRIVSTNLTSVFSTSRLAIPHMVHEKKEKSSISLPSGALPVPPVKLLIPHAKAASIPLQKHLQKNLHRAISRSTRSPVVSLIRR